MKTTRLMISLLLVTLLAACSGKSKSEQDNEQSAYAPMKDMNDRQRMDFMMRNAEPDSVARFLCKASTGKIKGVRIDALNDAYLYVMERYSGPDVDKFAIEFQHAKDQLPLADKMNTDFRLGLADSLQVGYELGLGYVNQIRTKHLSTQDVKAEIADFRRACAADTATYGRFLRGFSAALQAEPSRDIPKDIYNQYAR